MATPKKKPEEYRPEGLPDPEALMTSPRNTDAAGFELEKPDSQEPDYQQMSLNEPGITPEERQRRYQNYAASEFLREQREKHPEDYDEYGNYIRKRPELASSERNNQATKNLANAEAASAGQLKENAATDSGSIAKQENTEPDKFNYQQNQHQKSQAKGKTKSKNKNTLLGIFGAVGLGGGGIVFITILVSGVTALFMYSGFLRTAYSGLSVFINARTLMNTMRLTKAADEIKGGAGILRTTRFGTAVLESGGAFINRLSKQGLTFNTSSGLGGTYLDDIVMNLDQITGTNILSNPNISRAGKIDYLTKKLGSGIVNDLDLNQLDDGIVALKKGITTQNFKRIVNFADGESTGVISKLKRWFNLRQAAERLGIKSMWNLWGRAMNSLGRTVTHAEQSMWKLLFRKIKTLDQAQGVIKNFRAKYIEPYAAKARSISQKIGLIALIASVYCLLKGLVEAQPMVAEAGIVQPAIANVADLENCVDTLKVGNLDGNESALLVETCIKTHICSEYDPRQEAVIDTTNETVTHQYKQIDETNSRNIDNTASKVKVDGVWGYYVGEGNNREFVPDPNTIEISTDGSLSSVDVSTLQTPLVQSCVYNAQPLRAEAGEAFGDYGVNDAAYTTATTLSNLQNPSLLAKIGGTVMGVFSTLLGPIDEAACSITGQWIITIGSALATVVAAFFTGGGSAAAEEAVKQAALLALMGLLGGALKFFQGDGGDSSLLDVSNPETAGVVKAYGQIFLENEQLKNVGATKLSDSDVIAQTAEYREMLAWDYMQKPWYEKVFDGTDYRSVVSTVSRALNLNISSASAWSGLRNVGTVMLSMPQIFARIFSLTYSLDPVHAESTYDYGVDRYGFSMDFQNELTNDESGEYLFDTNAEALFDILKNNSSERQRLEKKLMRCNGKTIKISDGSFELVDLAYDNEAYNKNRRFYNQPDATQSADDSQCDSETDQNWKRMRIYLLDYFINTNMEAAATF